MPDPKPRWADLSHEFFTPGELTAQENIDFCARHEEEMRRLLPVLGPLFGIAVVSFGIWDFLIDATHAELTFVLRIALVLIGAPAYFTTGLSWGTTWRCCHIYCTHVGAIILSEYLLKDGFSYGLTGIAVCMFAASAVTLRMRDFLTILLFPSVLFFSLCLASLHGRELVNNVMLYVFSAGVASVVMLTIRYFREKALSLEMHLLQISRHDSMTGAYNRAFVSELAEREFSLARRYDRPLAIAMIDIDHFKAVNDNFGHSVGDDAIKVLVNTCQDNLRAIDHFGRLGGEEFICILPETNNTDAVLCAERLRAAIAALKMDTPDGTLQFTVSIGVAVLRTDHRNWDALLKDADSALYCAKREGRNRVVDADTRQFPNHSAARAID
ncbi:MAG TPA: GGDEF domain-containing protein [Burkholderiaceae bacterium]|jgi:diguanylate cyclase (GGDEF)-like protein